MAQSQDALTKIIAGRVKELRQRRGMTAKELADYMAKAGLPWRREIVANLENGRRDGLSVTELFALAVMLHVPPLALIIGDDAQEVPVVPAASEPAYDVWLWLLGEKPLTPSGAWLDAATPIRLVHRHFDDDRTVSNGLVTLSARERWAAEGRDGAEERLQEAREQLRRDIQRLAQTRAEMRGRGMQMPPVLPEAVDEAKLHGIVLEIDGEDD